MMTYQYEAFRNQKKYNLGIKYATTSFYLSNAIA